MGRPKKEKELTTNADRCKTYSEKNRARYRKNDANRKCIQLKLTDSKANALRFQEQRLSKQLWRLKKKKSEQISDDAVVITSPGSDLSHLHTPPPIFVAQTQRFPRRPGKRKEVMESMTSEVLKGENSTERWSTKHSKRAL